jgi:fluoride ion exporter CrcB/FEX
VTSLTGPRLIEDAGFITGALYVLLAQLIGFALYWLGWWVAKR